MARQRILTGMRPTGPLHLGHYSGALENWIELQHDYECYFLIADYQALGDHVEQIGMIRQSVLDVALDWLSVGLDPDESSFVIQSYIPEHTELTMYLSMITPLRMLQSNPTLKTELAQIKSSRKAVTVGFYTYPVSQIADILLPKAHLIPVGEDQIPHIEDTRNIARRFNRAYGDIFPVPRAKIGRIPRLVGVDGNAKMSKGLNNAIYLSDPPGVVRDKVKKMVTDITGQNPRLRATDPGIVEYNPVFSYHDAFNSDAAEVANLKELYSNGAVSDSVVKEQLIDALNEFLEPIREKRAHYESRPDEVHQILLNGTKREKKLAEETMQEVREAMGVIYT